MKSGSNVLFEGNTLTGPIDAASGTACPINTAFATNQDGSNPWAATNNNVFRNNLMLGVGAIFANQPYDTYCAGRTGQRDDIHQQPARVRGRYAVRVLAEHPARLELDHHAQHRAWRSEQHLSSVLRCTASCVTSNVTFRDNIVNSGGYWIQTLDLSTTQYPSMTQDHNVIINDTPYSPPSYTSTDFVVGSVGGVGFVNVASADAGGDYHGYALASSSPFKGRASEVAIPG